MSRNDLNKARVVVEHGSGRLKGVDACLSGWMWMYQKWLLHVASFITSVKFMEKRSG